MEAVLFAKWHRAQAIEEIYSDTMIVLAESLPEGHIHEEDYLKVKRNIESSILNAYPEDIIK